MKSATRKRGLHKRGYCIKTFFAQVCAILAGNYAQNAEKWNKSVQKAQKTHAATPVIKKTVSAQESLKSGQRRVQNMFKVSEQECFATVRLQSAPMHSGVASVQNVFAGLSCLD